MNPAKNLNLTSEKNSGGDSLEILSFIYYSRYFSPFTNVVTYAECLTGRISFVLLAFMVILYTGNDVVICCDYFLG